MSSAKAKLISKQTIRVIEYLAITSRRRKPSKYQVTSEDRYFNYNKFGHFGRDCKMLKKFKLEESKSKLTLQNRAYIAAADKNNSDLEFFQLGVANIVKKSMQASRSIWYLDSCASKYFTNNKDLLTLNYDSNPSTSPPSEVKYIRPKKSET